jgi:hypothetical protein
MPFPLSRSIDLLSSLTLTDLDYLPTPPRLAALPACLPCLEMADVQTNLLSFILTKLHADVARIESMIHQVHAGELPPTLSPAASSLIPRRHSRRRVSPPSTPDIRRRCPAHPLQGPAAHPRRPRAGTPLRCPRPAWITPPRNLPPDAHPQLEHAARCVSPRPRAAAAAHTSAERGRGVKADGAAAAEESAGAGVVGLQYRR